MDKHPLGLTTFVSIHGIRNAVAKLAGGMPVYTGSWRPRSDNPAPVEREASGTGLREVLRDPRNGIRIDVWTLARRAQS